MRKKNILSVILFIDAIISSFTTFLAYVICQEDSLNIPIKYFFIFFIAIFFIVFVSIKIGYGLGYLDGEIG